MKHHTLVALLCAITLGTMQSALAQSQSQRQSQGQSQRGEDLAGKEVVSVDGDVVGEVKEVTWSDELDAEVARISVGGFLGMAESEVDVPVSELSTSGDYQVQTSMTSDELQALAAEGSADEM